MMESISHKCKNVEELCLNFTISAICLVCFGFGRTEVLAVVKLVGEDKSMANPVVTRGIKYQQE